MTHFTQSLGIRMIVYVILLVRHFTCTSYHVLATNGQPEASTQLNEQPSLSKDHGNKMSDFNWSASSWDRDKVSARELPGSNEDDLWYSNPTPSLWPRGKDALETEQVASLSPGSFGYISYPKSIEPTITLEYIWLDTKIVLKKTPASFLDWQFPYINDKVSWHHHTIQYHDIITWYNIMTSSHDTVSWHHHTMKYHDIITRYSIMTSSRDTVSLQFLYQTPVSVKILKSMTRYSNHKLLFELNISNQHN